MKSLIACAPLAAILFLTACSQNPQRLLQEANRFHQNKKYKEASILYRKVIAKDKTNAEAYYREGLNLIDQNNPLEALQFLRRSVDLRPDNLDADSKLAEIYLAAYSTNPKKLKNLLPDIKDLTAKILKINPRSFEGLRLQGMIYLAEDNKPKALQTFALANQVKPHSRELTGWYAQTLAASGQSEQAEKLVRDTLAQDKTWGAGYDLLYLMKSRGSDATAAEAVLRDRLRNDPTSTVGLTNLSGYLLSKNRYDEAEKVVLPVLSDKKHFPNGHELMGDFYFRAHKFDQALAQYQSGVKDDSKNALLYQQRLVGTYIALGRKDDGLKLAKTLAEKYPKDTVTNDFYASLLLDVGNKADLDKSLPQLQKLVQNNGNDAVLHLDLARAHFANHELDKALVEANEASRLQPNLLAARMVIARIDEDRGQHAKALEQTEVILNTEPKNADARLIRDRALVGINERDQALPELESLVNQFPKANDARLELGNVYLANKDYARAKEQFEAAQKNGDARGFLGIQSVKLQEGKADEAIANLNTLVKDNPSNMSYRFTLANFEYAAGGAAYQTDAAKGKTLFEQASTNYKEILKTMTNPADVWLRLGVIQRQLGQNDSALASFEQAGNANPSSAEAFLNRAMLLEVLGKKKEARDTYNKVLGIEPENTVALNNLAFLSADSGDDLDQAMTLAERAKKHVPNDPNISDTLGYVYMKKNLNAEAVRIFRQVVETSPKNATFHYHLALALLKQGDKQGAKQEAEKALQISSQPDEQNKIRSLVGQIG